MGSPRRSSLLENEHRMVQRACRPSVCLDVEPIHAVLQGPRFVRHERWLEVRGWVETPGGRATAALGLPLEEEVVSRMRHVLVAGRGYLNLSDGDERLSILLGAGVSRSLRRALRPRRTRPKLEGDRVVGSKDRRNRLLWSALLLVAVSAAPAGASPLGSMAPTALHFEPSVQAGSYVARGGDIALAMTQDGIVVRTPGMTRAIALRFEGVGEMSLRAARPLPGVSNYLRGNDRRAWRTGVPHFGEVRYEDAASRIAIVVHADGRWLEYDVIVREGGHAEALERLALSVEGADAYCRDGDELVIQQGEGELRQRIPEILEEGPEPGTARILRGGIVPRGEMRFGFAVDGSSGSGTLVVDPVLDYGTYLGGGRDDAAYAIALDDAGAAFVAGVTSSLNFPTGDPLQGSCGSCGPSSSDAFLAKIAADGQTLLFSTYLGGSGADAASGVAVDRFGDVYVVGATESDDFPVVAPFQGVRGGAADAFLVKLSADGREVLLATYLGGEADDRATGVAVTSGPSALVVGVTRSPDFPTASALQPALAGESDAFILKLEQEGDRLIFGTFLGGAGADEASAVALDDLRRPHVAGAIGPHQLVALASDGSAVRYRASISAGGAVGRAVVVDGAGIAHVAYEHPGCHAPFLDVGLARVDPGGAVVGDERVLRCVEGTTTVDAVGLHPDGVVLAGQSTSVAQLERCAAESYHRGAGVDAFVATLDAAGTLVSPTSGYGGMAEDRARAVAVDPAGAVWIAGETRSADLPLARPLQGAIGGRPGVRDAFVARIAASAAKAPPVPDFVASNRTGRPPLAVLFSDLSSCDVTSRTWDFGDGTTSHERDPVHGYAAEGIYTVSLTVGNGAGSVTVARQDYVTVGEPVEAGFEPSPASGVAPLIVAFSNLSTPNTDSYLWSFGDGTTSSERAPTHGYTSVGDYTVSLVAWGPYGRNTEVRTAAVTVKEVIADFEASPRIVRAGEPVTFRSLAQGTVQGLEWTFGDGGAATTAVTSHAYTQTGYATVTLRVSGPSEREEITREAHVLVSAGDATDIALAPGPDPAAPPRIALHDVMGEPGVGFFAYGTPGYGANVGTGQLDGAAGDELLAGPGPGPAFGPQVRAFRADGSPMASVNFFAYGTMKHGVAATGAALASGAGDGIVTGAALAAPFAPHVRGFSLATGKLLPLSGVSFFAYGTLHHGVVLAAGDVDASGDDELVTGPGPGPTFAPVVRGFDVAAGAVARISGLTFDAFPALTHGVRVATSDLEGSDERILAAPGPSPYASTRLRAFTWDAPSVRAMPEIEVEVFPGQLYGAIPAGGDLDGDGLGEALVARSSDPTASMEIRGFDFDLSVFPRIPSTVVTAIPSLQVPPGTTRYGAIPATGDLGF